MPIGRALVTLPPIIDRHLVRCASYVGITGLPYAHGVRVWRVSADERPFRGQVTGIDVHPHDRARRVGVWRPPAGLADIRGTRDAGAECARHAGAARSRGRDTRGGRGRR
jgi:hypothetical protein